MYIQLPKDIQKKINVFKKKGETRTTISEDASITRKRTWRATYCQFNKDKQCLNHFGKLKREDIIREPSQTMWYTEATQTFAWVNKSTREP